ncbi:MAG: peptidylprolyl isomerase [Eubacteriales bacterium]|nr:peptidylprolyl isomerase [Eubacteriales bacterium]
MKRKIFTVLLAAALSVGMMTGCGGKKEASDQTEQKEAAVSQEEAEAAGFSDGQEKTGDAQEGGGAVLDTREELTGLHHAEITVADYGTIQVELDADTAPITVTNFVKLAQGSFYDGLTFHRIIDGFMIQGGDPLGNGTGGSDENIKGEFGSNGVENKISHTRGTISMARSSDPDSASSQFFIMHEDGTYLDGEYAAFGHVTEGMEVVDAICKAAEPTDDNGTIPSEEQPVIQSIRILD